MLPIDMRALSIRAKLTLWYLIVTFVGALLFGVTSYGALEYALLQGKKTHLLGREKRLLRLLEENKAEHVTTTLHEQLSNYALVTHEGNLFQLRNAEGTLLFPSDAKDTGWAFADASGCRQRVFRLASIDDDRAMVMCHAIVLQGIPSTLYLGGALDEEFDVLRTYRNILLFLCRAFSLSLPCAATSSAVGPWSQSIA